MFRLCPPKIIFPVDEKKEVSSSTDETNLSLLKEIYPREVKFIFLLDCIIKLLSQTEVILP